MTRTTAAAEVPSTSATRCKDLYHERTNFDFIGRSWRWALLSGILILISVVAFVVRGLNLGIDFEGGTQWQFTVAQGNVRVDRHPRRAQARLGLGDAKDR